MMAVKTVRVLVLRAELPRERSARVVARHVSEIKGVCFQVAAQRCYHKQSPRTRASTVN